MRSTDCYGEGPLVIHDLCREVGYWAGLAAEEHYDREFSAERETYQRLAPLGPWFIDCARTRMAWLECETAYQRGPKVVSHE